MPLVTGMGLTEPQRENWFETLNCNFNYANALAKRHKLKDDAALIDKTYIPTNDPSQYEIKYFREVTF